MLFLKDKNKINYITLRKTRAHKKLFNLNGKIIKTIYGSKLFATYKRRYCVQ